MTDVAYFDGDNGAASCPWVGRPDLESEVRKSLTALVHTELKGAWLLCAVDAHRVAWAFRAGRRGWSEGECLQWSAVAHALARWLDQSPAGEVQALQRDLEQAAVITGRLTHDFGNYLTGVLGFTELSLSQTSPDAPAHHYMQEVLQSAQQGAAWIHRLQLFCRRQAAPAWPTRLASVLALEDARLTEATASRVRLHVNLPNDLPLLDMDAGSLQTLLQELVNNACEAMGKHGTITVTARPIELSTDECRQMLGATQPGLHVELTIADDGSGLSGADRAKLFHEIFFSTKQRRRGVGLLVVYGILRSSRGGLRIDTASGKGLDLRVYVPTAVNEGPSFVNSAKPPHLLVAFANPVQFDSLRILLEARGCKITVADSPQAALNIFTAPKTSFALVIVDLNMPQLAGFDLARRILDHDRDANLLFLCTQPSFHGLADEDLPNRFQLLRWPLQPASLLAAVHTALTRTPS